MSDRNLPTGVVTFLFTDIEGSTRLVQALGDGYLPVLEAHNRILGDAVSANGGIGLKTEGDSLFAVFEAADRAALACLDAQRGLVEHGWPEDGMVRVRMGLHTGTGTLGGADYVGLDVHRAARISDAAHGGQIVLSEPTAVLIERHLPPGCSLRDLGKHRLKDLLDPETLFQIDAEGLETDFPELRTLDAIPNNLPLQLTSFVGREEELAEAIGLLEACRVLTLTGPGGTGKTRLSLQVAAESADGFADGVYFVSLSPVTDPAVVPSAILTALGLQVSSKDMSPRDHLVDHLSGKSALLVLDNFEQLLGAAPLVAELVRCSPRSKFLVTSRSPLRITGEQEMPVPPLAIPQTASDLASLTGSEAVNLFAERAMAVRPDFAVTAENAADVLELVRRLDGLPLAIELIASRVRLLPVRTIVERLDTKMLSFGAVDLPDRQRTIDGAISWSYDLLTDPQKELFACLSVFAGGARLEEIEKVCADTEASGMDLLDGLEALIDQSLLATVTSPAGPRFRMLHVIREYAAVRLAETGKESELRTRHLAAYAEMVEAVGPELLRKDRRIWLDSIQADHDNIRAALEWGQGQEVDLVLRLASGTWRFWQARGHLFEARRRLETALAQPGGSRQCRAKAMEAMGGILWWQGKMEECEGVYRQTLDTQREIGEPAEIANALYNHSLALAATGVADESWNELEEAEAIYRELDDPAGLGNVLWGKGNWAMFMGDNERTRELHLRSAEHYRRAGNEFGLGWSLYEIAYVSYKMGEAASGWPYTKEALELFASAKDVSGIVLLTLAAAAIALEVGDTTRAMRLAGGHHRLRESSGTDIAISEENEVPGLEPESLKALEGELAAAYAEGQAMTQEELVAYALDWVIP